MDVCFFSLYVHNIYENPCDMDLYADTTLIKVTLTRRYSADLSSTKGFSNRISSKPDNQSVPLSLDSVCMLLVII